MNESPTAITCISLTTDFGLEDEYVGVLKGVILRFAPSVPVIDLSHSVAPQNVMQTAYLLEAAYGYFPPRTLHVVVVDPGVGTDRRILWAKIDEQFFLAPDNGVLTLLLRKTEATEMRTVTNTELFLSPLSNTFHGRDIFAPVASKLAAGLSPEMLGPTVIPASAQLLDMPRPALDESTGTLTGRVIGHDHFGNLHTDIHLLQLQCLTVELEQLSVYLGDRLLGTLRQHYLQTPSGTVFPLLGSRSYLEIAASMASAADLLPDAPSLPVIVKKHLNP